MYCIKLSKNAKSNHQEELWVRFLTVRVRLEWIILAVWIAHFPYFFLLGNEPAKKKTTAYVRLKLNHNPPPIRVSRLLAESSLLLSAYLLIDDPQDLFKNKKGLAVFTQQMERYHNTFLKIQIICLKLKFFINFVNTTDAFIVKIY